MTPEGRLIIPPKDEKSKGFVGETFEETGVEMEGMNRKERRRLKAEMRRKKVGAE